MTSGHLVTDRDFPLLRDVNLCELHHSVRKFVSDLDLVHLSLALGFGHLVGKAVVVDEFLHQMVGVVISCPVAGVDVLEINGLEFLNRDLLAFRYDLYIVEVVDSGAFLTLCQNRQPLEEVSVKFGRFLVELILNEVKPGFLVSLGRSSVTLFRGFRIKGCLDDGSAE